MLERPYQKQNLNKRACGGSGGRGGGGGVCVCV
jgi:hypothetical protein